MTARNILKLSELRSETDLINPNSGYDLIFLNDFMIDANIGVYKHEKIKSQPLRINIIAKVKNPKKINYLYSLTPKGISQKTLYAINFLKQKMIEYDELKMEIDQDNNEFK